MSARAGDARTAAVEQMDPQWDRLRGEAREVIDREPGMAAFMYAGILDHESLEEAVAGRIAERLHHPALGADMLRRAFAALFAGEPRIRQVLRVDLAAVVDRDPVCERLIEPVLYFKGFHAIQAQRLAHWLWHQGRRDFALYLQSRVSEVCQVDIHPAVPLGRGLFLDHGTGIVIGSTAVIEDDVSILQNVTLGGTGKETGDRHPKVRRGVLIGAGATVLGNIEIGCCSRVAAGSVVLKPVPSGATVAGVPAKIVGEAGCAEPSRAMDHVLAAESV